ncbi:hypothetical protein [Candidatus Bathycorpusculum sp.]|uniref:hypothetical protein n=1 Tax=Candidatus Bathycorpusculum sp. TaxID=2994959 RepID=UPI00282F2DE3|nr:hypothetical protein [Candidatus Termitimicrobium sp.]MCL2685002.1 hypothetical protein [Candidatus Termitimicrobium sp.]
MGITNEVYYKSLLMTTALIFMVFGSIFVFQAIFSFGLELSLMGVGLLLIGSGMYLVSRKSTSKTLPTA